MHPFRRADVDSERQHPQFARASGRVAPAVGCLAPFPTGAYAHARTGRATAGRNFDHLWALLLLYPGLLLATFGMVFGDWPRRGRRQVGRVPLEARTLLSVSVAVILGYQAHLLALFARNLRDDPRAPLRRVRQERQSRCGDGCRMVADKRTCANGAPAVAAVARKRPHIV